MNWFTKLLPSRIRTDSSGKRSIPEGIWTSCPKCKSVLYRAELDRSASVCPKCGYHHRIPARQRLEELLDAEGHVEIGKDLKPVDFLKFKDSQRYRERLNRAQKETGENDAMVVIQGTMKGIPLVCCAFEFEFMAGSMGSVVGERFVRAAQTCLEQRIPLICFSASGGARMQEALTSLMQMAKTSAMLVELKEQGIPFISVLTDPTMGGVSASLAMLGDIIIAEPEALIGFAGPRVIEQTVRETLPEGFQRAEFLKEHGTVDIIMDRREMRDRLSALLAMMTHRNVG